MAERFSNGFEYLARREAEEREREHPAGWMAQKREHD